MTKKEFLEYVKRGEKAQTSVGEILSAREVKKVRAKPRHEEDDLQAQCMEYVRLQYHSTLIFMIPNAMSFGGVGTANRGQFFGKLGKLKKMGLLKGVADLFVSEPMRGFHGLYLEAKVGSNKLSPEQVIFQKAARMRNYDHQEFRTFDEFKTILDWYLSP